MKKYTLLLSLCTMCSNIDITNFWRNCFHIMSYQVNTLFLKMNSLFGGIAIYHAVGENVKAKLYFRCTE